MRRAAAAALALAALALIGMPGLPALAAGKPAHLDRQVLKAMQTGQSIDVIVVASSDLNLVQADLRRAGVKQTTRVPIAHGIAARLSPALLRYFQTDANVERILYNAPVHLTDTPFDRRWRLPIPLCSMPFRYGAMPWRR